MTALKFESLRHQISHFVHESRTPLLKRDLMKICDLAVDEKQIANALHTMCKAGELKQHAAPAGSGVGVRFAYGPGKNKPGADAPQGEEKKRKPARRTRKKRRAPARETKPRRPAPNDRSAARWALLDGGTFVLLGARKPVEVEPGLARKLLDLIRAGADLAALAAFIERLDKGAA